MSASTNDDNNNDNNDNNDSNDKICIETYNVNMSNDITVDRLKSQMGIDPKGNQQSHGLKIFQNTEQKKGIYLYQELPSDIITKMKADHIVSSSDSSFMYFGSKIGYKVGMNMGMNMYLTRQASFRKKGGEGEGIILKEYTYDEMVITTFNGIVWTPQFKFLSISIPKYMENDENLGYQKRIGCRTTPWILLNDINTNNKYAVISIHGNSGAVSPKRIQLLRSLCKEAVTLQSEGFLIVMGGDLNMEPPELNWTLGASEIDYSDNFTDALQKKKKIPISPKDMAQPCSGKLKHVYPNNIAEFPITHINRDSEFKGMLDWIFVSPAMQIANWIVDNIENTNTKNPSDHAPVRFEITDIIVNKSASSYSGINKRGGYYSIYINNKSNYLNLRTFHG